MSEFDPTGGDQSASELRPLRGKTILVTRPRNQVDHITAQFEALGATVIHFPTIEVAPPQSWHSLDAAIARITEYDWLVFTSANGAHFFFSRLIELQQPAEILTAKIICAIGPATARAIEASGTVASLIATDSKAEGALKAIIEYLGGPEKVRGLRFLIPRARIGRETLPASLRSLGADVDLVEAYQTVKPDVDPEAIVRIFSEQPIDAITFTSSSTVSNFAELMGLTDLSELLHNTLVACIGPVTAETAERHGLTRVIQPVTYNTTALVKCIVESIGKK